MENVVAFNNELSGLYDSKPPISKGKMAAITKAAMRAIKFYKHVVQSVEKFILKCKPEYKVPGLYVIDSIVRQSRHQFSIEKDVFAPRFARNMKDTFINLFHCPIDDRSRIIRVLNLWQKNNVFQPAVIQPLFDMASEISKMDYQMPSLSLADISSTSNGLNTSSGQESSTSMGCGGGVDDNNVSELSIGHRDHSTIRQLQHIQQLILLQSANEISSTSTGVKTLESVKINQRVLDFDYGDEDDDDTIESPNASNFPEGNNLTQLLKDPNVLRQLQTLQNFQKKKQAQEDKQLKLNEMRLQEEAFEKHIQNVLKGSSSGQDNSDATSKEVEFISEESKIEVINLDGNDSRSPTPDRDRYKRRRSRSRSRSRDRSGRDRDRRRRSRSRSRSPRSNRRRNSRERGDRSANDRNREKEREYERERRRKGLPDLKKNHLSVCSTTLWVGHLSKLVHQEELSDTFGKYGEIVSIDMIVPRGCAFIVMHRRQDAYKAMNALKNHKLQGRTITISWAAGKGVKSKEWKDFWDLDLGVTYIPWDKLGKDTDLEFLEDGGMFDEDSLPTWVKDKINQEKTTKDKAPPANVFTMEVPGIDTSQPPPTGTMMAGVQLVPPPFQMGGVPRLMGGPIGVPIPGIPMPNMVPGMPPHHMMLPPGYPPMPVDKSVPPPNPSDGVAPNGIGLPPGHFIGLPPLHLGMPPQFAQPPVGFNIPTQNAAPPNDDQMDIEMEVETSPNQLNGASKPPPPGPPPINFNQPPPLFPNFPNEISTENRRNPTEEDFDMGNRNNRDNRNDRSRWGGRDDQEDSRDRNIRDGPSDVNIGSGNGDIPPWRETNANFQNNVFSDNNCRGGLGNIPPLDLNVPSQGLGHRGADFFGRNEDFNDDHRGGSRDFFPNIGNRFGQPGGGASSMGGGNGSNQMPIGQPQFGNRMVGPMFIRAGPGQGGSRNNSQGGGFNYNENPFDRERDDRGNRMRGGVCDRRGGRGNWRDDDDNLFNRRGGNRYDRDRERDRDRDRNRDRDRSGRDRTSRDRNSRDLQSRRSRNKSVSQSREEEKPNPSSYSKKGQPLIQTVTNSKKEISMSPAGDTEEDWDDSGMQVNCMEDKQKSKEIINIPQTSSHYQNNTPQQNIEMEEETSEFVAPLPPPPILPLPSQKTEQGNFSNTPLYDEPVESVNPNNNAVELSNDNNNIFINNNIQQSFNVAENNEPPPFAQFPRSIDASTSPPPAHYDHNEENNSGQTENFNEE